MFASRHSNAHAVTKAVEQIRRAPCCLHPDKSYLQLVFASRHKGARSNGTRSSESEEPAIALTMIGMSAGGTAPLRTLLRTLPAPFPGALIVARHTSISGVLPELIKFWTPHRVVEVESGMRLISGVIYVCPGQRHIIVNPDATLSLSTKEKLAFVRPSLDWMFESAAGTYGARATAILLSGANGDGARGAQAIRRAGGLVLVQAPETCEYPQMPRAALGMGSASAELAPENIAPLLLERVAKVNSEYSNAWADPFECPSMEAG